ncbi:uncharacterized protein LOC111276815 [Durio zibethinus]|uniref:Uncharacterized protein LOC111276815 n=1 Tax=Durio zibethinus TaxID=66656 RepID=A0A6P5WSE1_DURZI|nr:uncharacterized protein LOC111276815 [Durio zibethinus]
MEPDDPFDWITDICQVSSSEESRLRLCSYFGMSDSDKSDSDSGWRNPPDIPVATTGIAMVSPPESPQDELLNVQYTPPEDREIFHTPPESRSTSTSFHNCYDDRMIGNGLDLDGETVAIGTDSADSRRAVDLERDTDLGFSEVEVDSAQRIEANSNPDGTFRRESEEIRVWKRGFSPKGQFSTESPSKRLKSLDFELPNEPLGAPKERCTEELLKSLKKWNFKNVTPSPGASSELELRNQRNHESTGEVGEGNVRKRRLDFRTEDIESDTEERNIVRENENGDGNCERNKNIVEDIDQVRDTVGNGLNSRGMVEKTERKRALPSWANNEREDDDESVDEELEVNEEELLSWDHGRKVDDERAVEELKANEKEFSSWANGRVGDDERADEEVEANETDLPSWANGRVRDNKRADEELDVNERETVDLDMDSDSLSEDFVEITLLDVLVKLKEDCEEDKSLECLSLLEVAERKWGAFSLDK